MKVPIVAALLLTFGLGFCLVQGYKVEPRTAAESGWTQGEDGYVSEVLTVNFDLPITASLFCGSSGAGGGYNVSVLTYPDGYPIAHGDTIDPGSHRWATCSLEVTCPDSFIKGRQVEVRWTRAGSDSIQYYWDGDPDNPMDNGPYKYGQLVVGGRGQPTRDLCMRCYSLLDPIDSTFWGMNVWSCTIPSVC